MIFEKILNINRPEIYYKFLDNNLVTNSYSSSWFITLFTDYIFDFNKSNYPKLRKKIFLNILSDKKIDSHIKLWKEYLLIDEIKKKFNYQNIKKSLDSIVEKESLNKQSKKEDIRYLIEKDVLRTLFIHENKEHINNLNSILISFESSFPHIGYCQGMNCVVSFLYQLLDYNEEETFYLFCGLSLNSKIS